MSIRCLRSPRLPDGSVSSRQTFAVTAAPPPPCLIHGGHRGDDRTTTAEKTGRAGEGGRQMFAFASGMLN